MRGEPRSVHSIRPRCRFLLAFARFARPRYRFACATPVVLRRRSCSGDRPARVRGPREGRVDRRTARERQLLATGACPSKSACGRRSLPQRPLDIRCRRCAIPRERRLLQKDGPTKIRVPTSSREGRRHPADRDAFHRSRPQDLRRGSLHTDFPRRSPAHAAHTFSPGWGEVPSRALQAPRCGHPRSMAFERRAPLLPAGLLVPGTDDPSTPAWLGRRGRRRS